MPTNADVFSTILSEVTGKPLKDISELLKLFRQKYSGGDSFDQQITQQQFDTLLAELREEKSGIFNWLLQEGLYPGQSVDTQRKPKKGFG